MEAVPDSEDDDWLQPWSSSGQSKLVGENIASNEVHRTPQDTNSSEASERAEESVITLHSSQISRTSKNLGQIAELPESNVLTKSKHMVSPDMATQEEFVLGDIPMTTEFQDFNEVQTQAEAEAEAGGSVIQTISHIPSGDTPPIGVMVSDPSSTIESTGNILPSPPTRAPETPQNVARTNPLVDSTEVSTSTGRTLRPRTYAQLHTYEYEHAKYVMECRAAGIQPVRFDGTRYRETDKNDRDFVPQPERPAKGATNQSPSEPLRTRTDDHDHSDDDHLTDSSGTLEAGRKRKRTKQGPRFRDPRNFDPSRVQSCISNGAGTEATSKPIESNVFDFPDDHWQANFDEVPASSPPRATQLAKIQHKDVIEDIQSAHPSILSSSSNDTATDTSEEDEAAAKARYARKLKGILPPSYLSRVTESSKNRKASALPLPRRVNQGFMKSNVPYCGKGIAKKKFSIPIAISNDTGPELTQSEDESLDLAISSNSHSNTPIRPLVRRASAHISAMFDDGDISEAEEAIDHMLPTPTRPNIRRKPRNKQRRIVRRSRAPEVYLEDLVRTMPQASITRELRIASRTIQRKNTGGTQLSRKSLFFHDHRHRVLPSTSESPKSQRPADQDVDEGSVDLERTIRQWENDTLPFPTRTRTHNVNRSANSFSRPKNHSGKHAVTSDHISTTFRDLTTRTKKTSKMYQTTLIDPIRIDQVHGSRKVNTRPISLPLSPTSIGERPTPDTRPDPSRGFFLDEEDEAESRTTIRRLNSGNKSASKLPLNQDDQSLTVPPGMLANVLGSRTFAGNLEHETGRFANTRRTIVARKRKTDYLQLFDQINNIFGEQADHISKVSQWQRTELPKAVSERRLIENESCSARINDRRKLQRKKPAMRKTLRPSSILPFVQRLSAPRSPHLPYSAFDFSEMVSDITYGADAVVPGVYFNQHTFLGTSGLARLLGYTDHGRLTRCYIDNRQLSLDHDHMAALAHGFDAIERTVECLVADLMVSDDSMRSIYDFLRFSCSIDEAIYSDIMYISQRLASLVEKTGRPPVTDSQLTLLALWLHTFSLLHSHALLTSAEADLDSSNRIFEEAMSRSLRLMLIIGYESLSGAIRRQRNQSNRIKGLSINFGDSAIEAWIVIAQLASTTQHGFWQRLDSFLELQDSMDQRIAERAWRTILQLSSITQFDCYGRSTPNSLSNWPAVQILLERVFRNYDTTTGYAAQCQDTYIRVVLRRIHKLIDHWKWSDCSIILGHGRTGGVLYNFFVRDLNLGNLRGERSLKAALPAFFGNLDDETCLAYSDIEVENVFGIFLKLVCLGLKQFIDKLSTSPLDKERARKRGIGVVDKFGTHGRLNFSASESITQETVSQVQNRFALEIAVYWAAGPWKDRGMSKVIQASRQAMSGSHLTLREININAWNRVIKLQVKRCEELATAESMLWMTSIVQADVSDVLQFRYQLRINMGKPKIQKQTMRNLTICLGNLRQCYLAYFNVLRDPLSSTTAKRLDLLWSNDLLKPVLQLQDSFVLSDHSSKPQDAAFAKQVEKSESSASIVEDVLKISRWLLESGRRFGPEEDSQDYGDLDILSSQNGIEVIDHEQRLEQKCSTLMKYAGPYLA